MAAPYAGRLLLLIGVMAMHAFFGIAIMMQSGLMVADWFGSMGRTWGVTPLEDQYTGGGIAWSIGEIPTLILAITVAIQWSRSDDRETKRRDRHATAPAKPSSRPTTHASPSSPTAMLAAADRAHYVTTKEELADRYGRGPRPIRRRVFWVTVATAAICPSPAFRG